MDVIRKREKMRTDNEVRELLKDPTEENLLILVDFVCKPMLMDILSNYSLLDLLQDYTHDSYCLLVNSILPNINLEEKPKPYLYTALKNMVITSVEKYKKCPRLDDVTESVCSRLNQLPSPVVNLAFEEHIRNFVLSNSPPEYVEMVEFILEDATHLFGERRKAYSALRKEFGVDGIIAKSVFDLTLMLARASFNTARPVIHPEITKGYKNPYLHALEVRFGENVAWTIASLLQGISVKL